MKDIDGIEPSGVYVALYNDVSLQIFDRDDFQGKHVVVKTKLHANLDKDSIQKQVKSLFKGVKSISFLDGDFDLEGH